MECARVWRILRGGLLVVLTVVFAVAASAQGRYTFQLRTTGSIAGDTLYFGWDPRASYCIDPDTFYFQGNPITEYELPPIPPSEIYDVRFGNHRPSVECVPPRLTRGEGLRLDLRQMLSGAQRDTFLVRIQPGVGGYPVTFQWDAGLEVFCDSMRFRDAFGGVIFNVNMLTSQMRAVGSPHTAANLIVFGGPKRVVLTSPANGASVPQNVTLSWNAIAGATLYRVQVASDTSFSPASLVVHDSTVTGTSFTAQGLPGSQTLHWRVSAGNVHGWAPFSDRRQFSTVLPPPAPSLSSPPNGAQNIVLNPTLIWNAVQTATGYHLQLSRDSLFQTLDLNDSTLTTTSRQVGPLISNTLYFWKVRARNLGGYGEFSTAFRFRTTLAPGTPQPLLPTDSATILPQMVTFVWHRVLTATSYHLQVATDVSFTALLVNDSTITDSTRPAGPFPYSARLFWRVRARNAAGPGPYSTPRVFWIMAAPPAVPVLVSPNDNAQVPVVAQLRWRAAQLAQWYNIQVARDTLMTNIFINRTGVTDTFTTVRLAPNTQYYWRVRGQNIEGIYGDYSVIRRMWVGNVAPAPPEPIFPANGDTNVARLVLFEWLESPGATHYRLQVALSNTFTTGIFFDDSTLTSGTQTVGILEPQTLYYWRVRARGTAGWSAYSLISSFRTGVLVGVDEPGPLAESPQSYALLQNYPNPFNPTTNIGFTVHGSGFTSIKVYDVLGREIATLVSDELRAGSYEVTWDASGRPSGVYIVRMVSAGEGMERPVVLVRKIVLAK